MMNERMFDNDGAPRKWPREALAEPTHQPSRGPRGRAVAGGLVVLPECQLNLAQAVTYLACAPKSNAATLGIAEARQDVREGRVLPVPVHLRDRSYPGAKRLGHGEGYQYSHDDPEGVA